MKTEFTYNGLLVTRDYFEHASEPLYCDKVSDSEMEDIVRELYGILIGTYFFNPKFLKGDGNDFIDNDDLLFAYNEELERLLLKHGAKYGND